MNTEKIALSLDVEVCDGLYYIADLETVDGSPWVTEKEFLEIVKNIDLIDCHSDSDNTYRGKYGFLRDDDAYPEYLR